MKFCVCCNQVFVAKVNTIPSDIRQKCFSMSSQSFLYESFFFFLNRCNSRVVGSMFTFRKFFLVEGNLQFSAPAWLLSSSCAAPLDIRLPFPAGSLAVLRLLAPRFPEAPNSLLEAQVLPQVSSLSPKEQGARGQLGSGLQALAWGPGIDKNGS